MKNVEDIYPLSPMQEGMMFHTLYAPGSGAYVVHISSRIQGNLNIAAFKRTWQKILERHPILRSAYLWDKVDKPLQIVRTEVKLPWYEPDWRGLSAEKQEQQLQDYLWSEHGQGFDLSQAPLMRMALIRLGDNKYQFVWNYSHLLLDGWSVQIIFEELFVFYRADSEGRTLNMPRPRPYRDFIAWMQKQDKAKAEEFWRETLKGFSVPTPLPIETAELPSTGPQHLEMAIEVDRETTAKLQALGRQHRITLNTFVQGAWAWLLGRYSAVEEVVFGVTVTGRPVSLRGVESVVGLLVNTLPMRVALNHDESLLNWLRRLQDHQLEIRQYEASSLVEVKSWSEVSGMLPLFETFVVFENHPVATGIQELRGDLHFLSSRVFESAAYPLTLLAEPGEQMRLRMMYDSSRFSTPTVTRILGEVRNVLANMAASPEQNVSELGLLSEAERRQLLIEWNQTEAPYSQGKCLPELVEEQALRTPQALAIINEQGNLSYKELEERANQLAHYLRALGIRPEMRVGVCVDRSLEMIVGILGVLKAGGAYVPLDPTYPSDRLGYVLEDSQAKVLLIQHRLSSQLPTFSGTVIELDSQWQSIAHHSSQNPIRIAAPENLAYVIYTSGSTGKPKGVAICHRSVVAFLTWVHQVFAKEDLAGVLASTSICFDLSVFELFAPLTCGGSAIVVKNALALAELPEAIAVQVKLINTVPSAMRELVRMKAVPDSVRIVNLAGEALPANLVQEIYTGNEIEQVFNLYGPSEDTTYSTYAHIPRAHNGLHVSIGKPIANTQVYVLDERMKPLPIGACGELFIGGDGLARGYLGRPALTAERFVPDPFSNRAGARLYRTGDWVRWHANETLEFTRRIDHQVKIRGYRIEMGEIETALCDLEKVEQAVVVVREDEPGEKRLVAYLVVSEEIPLQELGDSLKQNLPAYMIPADFMILESLPLTPNGKVDRRALPAPVKDMLRPKQSYVAPRNATETQLAQIWSEILRLEYVGVEDNFFLLGGHSLQATRVVARMRDAFKMDVPLPLLFQATTIAKLAEIVEEIKSERASGKSTPALPQIETADRDAVFVLIDED
jgi:amino acid adenylation domain-containing protein